MAVRQKLSEENRHLNRIIEVMSLRTTSEEALESDVHTSTAALQFIATRLLLDVLFERFKAMHSLANTSVSADLDAIDAELSRRATQLHKARQITESQTGLMRQVWHDMWHFRFSRSQG